jgi:hypothetical protein
MKSIKIYRVLVFTLIICLLLAVVPVIPVRALTGTIAISPATGAAGTLVTVTASGFTANKVYTINFAGVGITTGNTGTTGNFTAYFTVPLYPRAAHAVTVTTTAPDTSNTVYFTVTPMISLSALSGYVGDSIAVTGTGFKASSSVTIYFDSTSRTTTTTTSSGTFTSVSITIPNSVAGSHLIKGTDTSGDSPGVGFLVQPKMTVNPVSGIVGSQVDLSGTGFRASSGVTIYFDDESVKTAQTNSTGSFSSVSLNIPESYQGSHTIKAQDAGGNFATTSFTISPTVTISATSGTPNSKVAISGNGFKASSVIVVSFDDISVMTTPAPIVSSSKGSFSAEFTVPPFSGGTHQIKVSDGTSIDTKSFSILSVLSIEPTSGFVGSEVSLNGVGFQASQSVTITFNNKTVETTATDGNGRFNISFNVPVYVGDTYKVVASDGTNTKEVSFTITTSASISETTGHVGTAVTVTGIGFTAGKTVTITYDGNQVATTTTGANGSFSTSFNVPASKKGEHVINATDGINNIRNTFTMESTPPAIPVPLKPEMNIKAKSQTYFDWDDVTDPSGVTYTLQVATSASFSQSTIILEKTGLELSEYTLTKEERLKTVKKDSPYYWHVKAVDGASNESRWTGAGSFYVGIYISQTVIYILIGVGALLLAVFAFWLGRRTAYRD